MHPVLRNARLAVASEFQITVVEAVVNRVTLHIGQVFVRETGTHRPLGLLHRSVEPGGDRREHRRTQGASLIAGHHPDRNADDIGHRLHHERRFAGDAADGEDVVDGHMKHTYNIAFAIYALSCYYNASGDKEALELAYKLFHDIENNTLDEYGYREAFDRQWNLVSNDALSENGLHADKTMNAILHLIEAYTELYKADHNEEVAKRLKFQLGQMRDIVYTPETNALKVFFDTKFDLVGDIHSFGHDIEATWLMDLACDTLGDEELKKQFAEMDLKISHNIQNIALDNGALNNERENDKIDKKRVWWVEAESVVGFINAYQHSGEKKFLESARSVWEYIKAEIIDKREGSEWYAEVSYDHKPHDWKEIVGPWKCPYHNGRMCMEVINRGVDF